MNGWVNNTFTPQLVDFPLKSRAILKMLSTQQLEMQQTQDW
jgi:hypothetical protein